MNKEFNKDLGKYLASRKRKGLFSGFRFEISTKGKSSEREISQKEINALLEKKGIKSELEIGRKKENEDGWREIRLEELWETEQKKKELGIQSEPTQEIIEIQTTEKSLENDITLLKEQKMNVLKNRVYNVLFKKRQEIESEAKIGAIRKAIVKEEKAFLDKSDNIKQLDKEVKKEKGALKSFFSNFIQIRTAAEIAKEEEEKLKQEEEQAIKNQLAIFDMLQYNKEETKTNAPPQPAQEPEVDFSDLFSKEEAPEMKESKEEVKTEEDTSYKSFRELFGE